MLFETQEERDKIIKNPTFVLVLNIIKEIFIQIRRYLFFIPLLVLISFGYVYRTAKNLAPTYSADLTFIITQQEKSAGRNNALEELGFSGRGNKPSINFDKLKMYGFSKKIISRALFSEIKYMGIQDNCANHMMRLYGYPQQQPFFINPDIENIDSLPINQLSVLNGLIGIIRSSLVSLSYGVGDVYMITVKSKDEAFALKFSEVYFNALKDFYIETALGSSYSSYKYFKNRLDSLSGALTSIDFAVANFNDKSHNIVKEVAMVPLADLERRKLALSSTYSEALKQFEIAKVDYENAAPVFIILDNPTPPLTSDAPTARSRYIIAAAAAIFVYFFIIFLTLIWKYFGFIVIALFKD